QLRVRNGIARNFLPVQQRARAIGGVMNLMSLPIAIRGVLSVLLLTPAASFSAALVQRNPAMRPANADSPILIWDVDLKLAKSLLRNFRETGEHLEAQSGQE